MEIHRTVLSKCPVCAHLIDANTATDGSDYAPQKGDASICMDCMTILLFNADLSLREATEEEIAEFPNEIRQTLNKVREHFGKTND